METHDFPITNDPACVPQVQARLQALLQASEIRPRFISALNLAAGEWLENILQHAYGDQASHAILVQCQITPASIAVQVTDDGRRFNPWAEPALDPAQAGQPAVSGRGLHLIRHLVDRVEYQWRDQRNVVRLIKDLN
ncbi:MAG: hypothetical protein RJA22_319 [Verrucomicrobiota bacterium]|jgi:anti-sigma regulatory factor (Ser/Thr protein kinase)